MDDVREGDFQFGASMPPEPQIELADNDVGESGNRLAGDAGGPDYVFDFDVGLDVANAIIVSQSEAQVYGRFRHMADSAISLEPGVKGAFNVGVQLLEKGTIITVFEERMTTDAGEIAPGEWVGVRFSIPRDKINFEKEYELVVDIVKEYEYWFAAKGVPPRHFDTSFIDGEAPIGSGSWQPQKINSYELSLSSQTDRNIKLQIVFDVSDLIQYFYNARLPTGIQRVQIEIITNLILTNVDDFDLKLCCFTRESDSWLELPIMFFNHISKLALVSGETDAADWKRVLEELKLHLSQAKSLVFQRGAYLINLGTSWWLQNYFLHVRDAKARYGIRYVPYVHDCIPIMTPEHCVENLTRDFITWALGAFQHADHILVNSKATAQDVKAVALRLGHSVEDPNVVTLDADFRSATSALPKEFSAPSRASEILLKHDLGTGTYVLFVSTVESRKNHLMAFSAWLTLAKQHGSVRVPKLVCVGNRGWLNDAIYAKVSSSRILQQKIVFLSKISDPDLELLYRNCLFTLYPSSYEGWGLPVTESLCYGKVPVLANSSSLPEAGGEFAEYFDVRSETDLLKAVERLLFDQDYRTEKEQRIVERFQARKWADIASQVVDIIKTWAATDPPIDLGREISSERGLWPFPVALGQYCGITENLETQIWPGMSSAEIYRQGPGWWWPEPWGCWTKPTVARIAFLAPLVDGQTAVLYVGVKGVQGLACRATVNAVGIGRREVSLAPDQIQWLIFRLSAATADALPRTIGGTLIELRFSADKVADFRALTGGVDPRVASVGVTGFMIARSEDIEARMAFVEGLIMNDINGKANE